MSWYNTGDPRQDWASNWRHLWTLEGGGNTLWWAIWKWTACNSRGLTCWVCHQKDLEGCEWRCRGKLKDTAGRMSVYSSLSADFHWHFFIMSVGGFTCWSRVKVRVSRTNWETESSAVDGCRTRLTSQPLEDTIPSAVLTTQTPRGEICENQSYNKQCSICL